MLSSFFVNKNDRLLLPELFYHTDIEPSLRTRSRPMKVLVVGMARTGTMSIRSALEMIGIGPCYHMMSWYTNPKDGKLWRRAIDAKFYPHSGELPLTRSEWDNLLGDCEGALDAPAVAFMDELISAYPEAKIILAQRDPTLWARSYRDTIGHSAGDWLLGTIIAPLDEYFLKDHVPAVRKLFTALLGPDHLSGSLGGAEEKEMIRRYIRLHENVKAVVPEDKLLLWNLEDGWEPLCKFLETPVPNAKLPHVNDKKVFARRQYLRKWLALDRIIYRYCSILLLIMAAMVSIFLRLP